VVRAFSGAGGLQASFAGLGTDFQQGVYVAAGAMQVFDASAQDDGYEENDNSSQAADLGTLTAMTSLGGLRLQDEADWFRFRLNGTGTASSTVRIEFQHALGDVDMGLYNSSGTLVRRSDGISNSEQVWLNGLPAGDYLVHVYGYQGVHNPEYSLSINPGLVGLGAAAATCCT
jgi:hypothetical protein